MSKYFTTKHKCVYRVNQIKLLFCYTTLNFFHKVKNKIKINKSLNKCSKTECKICKQKISKLG